MSMTNTYMQRVAARTPTRFWINNPTGAELELAVRSGALSGTTNPTYSANLLKREPAYINPILDEVVSQVPDDEEAADLVYQRVSKRFMQAFMPRYKKSGGRQGFVTMQDDPRRDHRAELIVHAALRHAEVSPNYMAKIPVIASGMEAMAELIRRNMPICATECFSISQTIAMCDLYEKVSAECGHRPPFFITHITGIFDEEQEDRVRRDGISIDPEVLKQAGCIVGRKEYRVLKERGYHTVLLGGGARGIHHFTEFVGGEVHITMNWSTIQEMIDADPAVEIRIDDEASPAVLEELNAKLPDFRRAYADDGLAVEAFDEFPPLLRFRRNFVDGCDCVLEAIRSKRAAGN